MTPESFHDAARDAPIDGRSAFTMALRTAMLQAVQTRQREICLVDPDFEVWPLDDAEFLAALAAWGRLPLRRMILVACNFNLVPRRYARFTEWRGNWAHVVEAHATDIEPSQVPTLMLAGPASLLLADRLRWRGHAMTSDKEVADWREVVDALMQRSEPAFGANTLGL